MIKDTWSIPIPWEVSLEPSRHFLSCTAPICQDDPNPNYRDSVVWYAGEEVCKKQPLSTFQKKQNVINRLVKRGEMNLGKAYTAKTL